MPSSAASTFWPALERVRGLQAVPALWRAALRSEFEAASRYIRPIQEMANAYPCLQPGGCGFPHRVIHHGPGDIVAVSEAGDGECEELELRREDLVIHELNLARLGKDLAAALGLQAPPCQHDFLQTTIVGALPSDRGALPVAFGIYADEQALTNQTQRLRAAIPAGAIVLLMPSGRLLTQPTRERLSVLGFHPVPLENFCLMGVGGILEAKASLQHHLELSLPVGMVGGIGSPKKSQAPASEPCRFVRKGAAWDVAFGAIRSNVKHTTGMTHLHVLLSHPDRELRAFDVSQMANGRSGERYQDDGGEVADRVYLRAYDQKVKAVKEQIEDANLLRDHDKLERLEAELEELEGFESQLKGVGGKARRTNSTTERYRNSVRKAVERALGDINGVSPELHRHLKNSIQLGNRCVYRPDRPIDWLLADEERAPVSTSPGRS